MYAIKDEADQGTERVSYYKTRVGGVLYLSRDCEVWITSGCPGKRFRFIRWTYTVATAARVEEVLGISGLPLRYDLTLPVEI